MVAFTLVAWSVCLSWDIIFKFERSELLSVTTFFFLLELFGIVSVTLY